MSGNRFPNLMSLLGLLDAIVGLAFFLLKLALFGAVIALIVTLFD
jgi:hypothetical protein